VNGPPTGTRVGPALAALMARARIVAHDHTSMRDKELRHAYDTERMERAERFLAPHAQAVIDALGGIDAWPEPLRPLLTEAANPQHQFGAIFDIILAFIGVFSVAGALVAPPIQALVNEQWSLNLDMPLPVAESVLAVLKGHNTIEQAYAEAERTGWTHSRVDTYLANVGEPPGLQELLLLFRRGQIDSDRLDHGIRQSRVRDEWIDAVHGLQYGPPPAADAVAAAVQNQLTLEEAAAKLAQAGINPDEFDWLYRTHGRPPGIAEFGQLVNRGWASDDDWRQAIRESDIKDKYIEQILHLREYLPPVRSIPTMLRHGGLTPDRAAQLLRAHGVADVDVPAYLAEATSLKLAAHKEIALGEIKTALADGYIDQPAAEQLIGALGYDAQEVAFIVGLAEHQREIKLRDEGVSRVHSRYVARRIDRPTAGAELDLLLVPAAMRDQLLATWDVERDVSVAQLTMAQLTKAWKAGLLTDQDMRDRLTARGYSPADVELLVATL
jgi:hypothetical protein